MTWEQQARLTHPPRTITDVTDKCSLTSTALYVLLLLLLLLFLILTPFLLNTPAADAPVDYDKCAQFFRAQHFYMQRSVKNI